MIVRLGKWGCQFAAEFGRSGLFLVKVIFRKPRWSRLLGFLIQAIYQVGILSLPIIIVSGLFIGMVVALQGFHTLQQFGAEQELGQLLALSVVRELGPVVTALLFAGRAGSALTAEIGLMRATDQLDAMSMMAVDPLWRVVAPRFYAGLISMPILTVFFNVMAILGGYWVGVQWLGVDGGSFWNNMQAAVVFKADILNGLIKSMVFGFVVTWVAVFQGFYSPANAGGMARATTKTVVYSSLMILGLDFILTAVMMGGW